MHYFSWPFCLLPASQSFALWFDVISPPTCTFVGGTVWSATSSHQGVYTITQQPGQGPEDWNVTLKQELGDCFSCLIGGHIWQNVLHEMVLEHQDVGNFRQSVQLQGYLYASKIYMQEVHRSSGHNWVWDTLGKLPSCCKHHTQDLMDCCIWLTIPGHQKHYHNKDKVWSWPWWPTSLWQPFKVVTWWALGTTKSRRSSFLSLGIECRYRAPWWIMKFCQSCRISWPSSLEACCARSAFKSVFFCAFSKSRTWPNIGSPLWALAQSVTCICTSAQPVATCTSCSKQWSPLTMAGSQTSAQCAAPIDTPSRIDLTVLGSSQVVTQLSTFATVFSHPFWYSNSKLNHTRALTHQWLVASRLGVINGLLSVFTRKGW